jgi:hypothetical protein
MTDNDERPRGANFGKKYDMSFSRSKDAIRDKLISYARDYEAKYGAGFPSFELDIIPPPTLREMVERAIRRHIDDDEIEAGARQAELETGAIREKLIAFGPPGLTSSAAPAPLHRRHREGNRPAARFEDAVRFAAKVLAGPSRFAWTLRCRRCKRPLDQPRPEFNWLCIRCLETEQNPPQPQRALKRTVRAIRWAPTSSVSPNGWSTSTARRLMSARPCSGSSPTDPTQTLLDPPGQRQRPGPTSRAHILDRSRGY